MRGLGVEKDPVRAARLYRQAAEGGYAKAAFNLALCYEQGQGVEEDPQAAVTWFGLAADLGDDKAKARHHRVGVKKARS